MFKIIAFSLLFNFLGLPCILAQAPINNDCTNASSVTIGSGGFGLGTYTSTQFDISAATVQTGETFASSFQNRLTKKSVWYKFSLPTNRAVTVSLSQPGSAIKSGDVGFAVYKSNTCIPGKIDISTKFSPIETFGKTSHPCVDVGDYLVQVSSNNNANGPVFITVETSEPNQLKSEDFDKAANAYKFTNVNNNKTSAIDFHVECQTIDNAAENCLPNGRFKDYTKSTWHTFKTPNYFDWFSVLLSESDNDDYLGVDYTVGYRLYEGDATTTAVASLLQVGGCDSIKTNGFYPGRKAYRCSQLKPIPLTQYSYYIIKILYGTCGWGLCGAEMHLPKRHNH